MLRLNQALGAATALYSAAIIAKPEWLAKPCGLRLGADGSAPRETRLLIGAIGARDAALGTAMVCAPDTRARQAATGCRIAADLSDAALFGALLPDPKAKAKVVAFATAWAGICALSLCGGASR